MRRILKWIGIVLGVLLVILIIAAVIFYFDGNSQLNASSPDIEAEMITIPPDDKALARGSYLASFICTECHRGNLAGSIPEDIFIDEGGIVTVYAANLTPGEGGIGDLSDADLVRAIRHGVDQDGRHLFVMPAEIFINWSEEDIGSVIAYLRTLPPVDNVVPEPSVGFLGKVMYGVGMFGNIFPASHIDHDKPFPEMPEIGVNEAYGQYLASAVACTMCHGDDLTGGVTPAFAPPFGFPDPPDLTGDNLVGWTVDNFNQLLRTGIRPDGSEIDTEWMDPALFSKMSAEDVSALWLYIQSLQAADSANE